MNNLIEIKNYFDNNQNINKLITRKGYIIKKKEINENIINKIKKELTVKPFVHKDYQNFVEEFTVFYENEKLLYLPRYWGIKNIGEPNKIKIKSGENINLECKFKPRKEQIPILEIIYQELLQNLGTVLSINCGGGKCLGKNTKILMYDGTIKNVQDIKINDKIMGDDSKPRNILSICKGQEQLYKIKPKYGNSYIVNKSHILSLKCSKDNNLGKKNDKIDISLKKYLNLPINDKNTLYGYKIPIYFKKKYIEINSYIIGLWLGYNKNIELFIKENNKLLNNLIINKFNKILNKYDIIKNKYIPINYKCNSKKERLNLLAGIIDINGYIINNEYYIINNVEKLIDDIVYICLSLGIYCEKKKIVKRKDINEKIFYRIIIKGNGIQNIPTRKKKIKILQNFKNYLESEIKVIKLNIGNYYGFEIDGNKRFVLNDFTVTHNTILSLMLMCKLKAKTLVIVHTTVLLNQWIERINECVPNARIGIIKGNKIDIENKDVVICMLQTMCSINKTFPKGFFDKFNLSIWDECFPYKHFVTTNKGSFHIGKLYNMWKNNENLPLIKSYNLDKHKFEMKKITYAWKKPIMDKELVKITFYNNITVTCTKNHKFLVLDQANRYKKTKDKYIYTEAKLLKSKNNGSIIIAQYGKLKVKTIEYIQNEELFLYDIEVEDNHNFLISSDITKNAPIVSNCHRTAAPTFSRALPLIGTKYYLGLSATPKRSDHLENIFFWHLGDIGYKQKKGQDNKEVIIKYINYHSENYQEIKRWNGSYDLQKMLDLIIKNKLRRKFILNQLIYLSKCNRKILVLSSRKNNLKQMKDKIDNLNLCKKNENENFLINFFKNKGFEDKIYNIILNYLLVNITTGYYIGGMKTSDLEISSKSDIIFGTYQLVSEGMDIPTLDTLIMILPRKEIEQVVGRILRGKSKNIPLVLDICDKFSVYNNQGNYRKKHYKLCKYHIDEFQINEDNYNTLIIKDFKETENSNKIKFKKSKISIKNKTIEESFSKLNINSEHETFNKLMINFDDD